MKILTYMTLMMSFILIPVSSYSQDMTNTKLHSISLKTGFLQLKDQFNYGLTFNGIILAGNYSFERSIMQNKLIYNSEIGFSANYKKGIGLAWNLKPIDLFYGHSLNNNGSRIVGGYISAIYMWQLYPELQSGHMFWFTSMEIGPQVIFSIPVKSKMLKITVSNSIAGLTSRPEPATEQYYYSLTFSDFINNSHMNMKFSPFFHFNHTCIDIEMENGTRKRLTLGYSFEYLAYYQEPNFGYMNHTFNLKWKIGKI